MFDEIRQDIKDSTTHYPRNQWQRLMIFLNNQDDQTVILPLAKNPRYTSVAETILTRNNSFTNISPELTHQDFAGIIEAQCHPQVGSSDGISIVEDKQAGAKFRKKLAAGLLSNIAKNYPLSLVGIITASLANAVRRAEAVEIDDLPSDDDEHAEDQQADAIASSSAQVREDDNNAARILSTEDISAILKSSKVRDNLYHAAVTKPELGMRLVAISEFVELHPFHTQKLLATLIFDRSQEALLKGKGLANADIPDATINAIFKPTTIRGSNVKSVYQLLVEKALTEKGFGQAMLENAHFTAKAKNADYAHIAVATIEKKLKKEQATIEAQAQANTTIAVAAFRKITEKDANFFADDDANNYRTPSKTELIQRLVSAAQGNLPLAQVLFNNNNFAAHCDATGHMADILIAHLARAEENDDGDANAVGYADAVFALLNHDDVTHEVLNTIVQTLRRYDNQSRLVTHHVLVRALATTEPHPSPASDVEPQSSTTILNQNANLTFLFDKLFSSDQFEGNNAKIVISGAMNDITLAKLILTTPMILKHIAPVDATRLILAHHGGLRDNDTRANINQAINDAGYTLPNKQSLAHGTCLGQLIQADPTDVLELMANHVDEDGTATNLPDGFRMEYDEITRLCQYLKGNAANLNRFLSVCFKSRFSHDDSRNHLFQVNLHTLLKDHLEVTEVNDTKSLFTDSHEVRTFVQCALPASQYQALEALAFPAGSNQAPATDAAAPANDADEAGSSEQHADNQEQDKQVEKEADEFEQVPVDDSDKEQPALQHPQLFSTTDHLSLWQRFKQRLSNWRNGFKATAPLTQDDINNAVITTNVETLLSDKAAAIKLFTDYNDVLANKTPFERTVGIEPLLTLEQKLTIANAHGPAFRLNFLDAILNPSPSDNLNKVKLSPAYQQFMKHLAKDCKDMFKVINYDKDGTKKQEDGTTPKQKIFDIIAGHLLKHKDHDKFLDTYLGAFRDVGVAIESFLSNRTYISWNTIKFWSWKNIKRYFTDRRNIDSHFDSYTAEAAKLFQVDAAFPVLAKLGPAALDIAIQHGDSFILRPNPSERMVDPSEDSVSQEADGTVNSKKPLILTRCFDNLLKAAVLNPAIANAIAESPLPIMHKFHDYIFASYWNGVLFIKDNLSAKEQCQPDYEKIMGGRAKAAGDEPYRRFNHYRLAKQLLANFTGENLLKVARERKQRKEPQSQNATSNASRMNVRNASPSDYINHDIPAILFAGSMDKSVAQVIESDKNLVEHIRKYVNSHQNDAPLLDVQRTRLSNSLWGASAMAKATSNRGRALPQTPNRRKGTQRHRPLPRRPGPTRTPPALPPRGSAADQQTPVPPERKDSLPVETTSGSAASPAAEMQSDNQTTASSSTMPQKAPLTIVTTEAITIESGNADIVASPKAETESCTHSTIAAALAPPPAPALPPLVSAQPRIAVATHEASASHSLGGAVDNSQRDHQPSPFLSGERNALLSAIKTGVQLKSRSEKEIADEYKNRRDKQIAAGSEDAKESKTIDMLRDALRSNRAFITVNSSNDVSSDDEKDWSNEETVDADDSSTSSPNSPRGSQAGS